MPYSIGVDYGTQSGRIIMLDLSNAQEVGVSIIPYAHGVIDDVLPSTDEQLPSEWALQHPQDYLDVLHQGISDVIRKTGVNPNDIIGIGVDFTSCTVLPVTIDGIPLCMQERWKDRKHAWPKLWKHHSAQVMADRINQIAKTRDESFLSLYGGQISPEWYFPKLLEVFEEDREVYDASDAFIEAADWIVWYLTGKQMRNSCTAGYKAMWSADDGLPSNEFFAAVNPEFLEPDAKLGDIFYPLASKAGTVRPVLAAELGLPIDVAVAVGNIDAMVSVPAVGVNTPGSLVMVMGTSICHLTLTEEEVRLPGVTGVVKDGVLPGYFGYEAGQAAVGDMYEWFVKSYVTNIYYEQASTQGLTIYEYLERLANDLRPGESGLMALDWWNGNRSILSDSDLSGIIIGFNLATTVQEIYRTLLESTAFGTRRIIENFNNHGIKIAELVVCGGLPLKSPLLMQILSDVCGLPVSVSESSEIPARGAAMFGAVAAGSSSGGYNSIQEASIALASPILNTYHPEIKSQEEYNALYQIYLDLYSYFGQEKTSLMHRLKSIRRSVN